MLDYLDIKPTTVHKATVIWLHGLGADGHDFEGIVPELSLPDDHGIKFIFPHAPHRSVTINGGMHMRAWYDITSPDRGGLDDDIEGVKASVASINGLIRQEIQSGLARDKILLVGFSQGGVVALHAGLNASKPLGGVAGLSTYVMRMDELKAAKHKLPIFMAHGTQDPVLPFQLADLSQQTLKAKGYDVTWHSYPMQHQVCDEELKQLSEFLKSVLF